MAENLGINEYTLTSVNILHNSQNLNVVGVELKANAGDLSEGQVLCKEVSTGYYVPYAKPTAKTGDVIATGNGSTKDFEVTTNTGTNLQPGSVTIKATIGGTQKTLTDKGNGYIEGADGYATISYADGRIRIHFDTAPDNGTNITADYNYYGATNGLQTPVAILAEPKSVGSNTVKANAYISGAFRKSKLAPANIDDYAINKLKEIGILIY